MLTPFTTMSWLLTMVHTKTHNLKKKSKVEELWLGGNPIQCDCDMLWLITWLNNTRVSGRRRVKDYQDVICTGGQLDGTLVYKIVKVKTQQRHPSKFKLWTRPQSNPFSTKLKHCMNPIFSFNSIRNTRGRGYIQVNDVSTPTWEQNQPNSSKTGLIFMVSV